MGGYSDFSAACIGLMLAASAVVLLKNLGFKGAAVVAAAAAVFFVRSFDGVFEAIGETYSYISLRADVSEYAAAALKVVGIGYLSGICADVCRELGESGIAKCIGVIAKLEFVAIAAPFIRDILELSLKFIGE